MPGNRRGWKRVLLGLVAILVLYGVGTVPSLYGEYLWFAALGYESVFLRILGYRVGVFVLAALGSFAVLYASYRVATKNLRRIGAPDPSWPYRAGIIALALLIGLIYASTWDIVLRFLHATRFGVADPVFGRDVAFYVYTLPFLNLVIWYLIVVTGMGLVVSLALYARRFVAIEDDDEDEHEGVYDDGSVS